MKNIKVKPYIFLSLIILLTLSCQKIENKTFTVEELSLIPQPNSLKLQEGSFHINNNTVIFIEHSIQKSAATLFKKQFKKVSGIDLKIDSSSTDRLKNTIVFRDNSNLDKEAYTFKSSNENIELQASNYEGYLHVVQTLFQLLPREVNGNDTYENIDWQVPNVHIEDAPRFKWRGFMLDVSRHFFDKDYIIKVLDGLAMHKLNVLHLHLVDDQGWRIEIKQYPKLTEVGAWRVDQEEKPWQNRNKTSAEEKGTYGGFFTQTDLKEIVAYAQTLGIEVIPEIELPAHVSSAIASYPYLSCHENPIGVPSGGLWPITDIYCPGKETTFEFLENVLTEVMEIFPSKYIHIGGDEATKTNWKNCKHCQQRVTNEQLENVEELQSYFITRIEKFLNANNRRMLGWDEILEGGLAPNATVMSWRGTKGGIEAAQEGHDVVMTPTGFCYFDYYQGPQNKEPLAWGGYLPLSKVYSFNPIPEVLTTEQAKHILGGQANLWTEYVPTNQQADYMIFPRIAAMAEALWTVAEKKDWNSFSQRIQNTFDKYQIKGINYAKSAFLIDKKTEIDIENQLVKVELFNEFPNSEIRFTLNGQNIDDKSIKYSKPFEVSNSTFIKGSLFKDNKPFGLVFEDSIIFHKAVAKEVAYARPPSERYSGQGETTFVNTLRGSKNFHDGQWQAWLGEHMEVTINLEETQSIEKVTVGALEHQSPGIYFPTEIVVSTSADGKIFTEQGKVKRSYKTNPTSELKDFIITFDPVNTKFVKVFVRNLVSPPKGGGAWLFIDEILVN